MEISREQLFLAGLDPDPPLSEQERSDIWERLDREKYFLFDSLPFNPGHLRVVHRPAAKPKASTPTQLAKRAKRKAQKAARKRNR